MAMVFRSNTLGEARGFMKMLIDKNSDQILGFASLAWKPANPWPPYKPPC